LNYTENDICLVGSFLLPHTADRHTHSQRDR